MDKTENEALIKAKVTDVIRHAVQTRIGDHARQEGFQLIDLAGTQTAGQVLGNWMSIILVTGDAIRITLKLHFAYRDAKAISQVVYGVKNPDDISDTKAVDFIKEFSNLTAGYIVKIFESVNISMGISLPLCTRGLYEIFADYVPASKPLIRYSDIWRLEHEGHFINGSVMVEISNAKAIEALLNYDISDENAEDDSEFDFL